MTPEVRAISAAKTDVDVDADADADADAAAELSNRESIGRIGRVLLE